MDRKTQLLTRLDEIGRSLEKTGNALALLGLGSVGTELDRLDDYSDLDFFVIVKKGYKQAFIDNLDWLSSVQSVVYAFKNTVDGYKAMYEDGVFCEYAVFEADELKNIPFGEGRIVWRDPAFDSTAAVPAPHKHSSKDTAWYVGEALTNLYVGLCRYHRGEKLSAARFIQGYAVDRIVDLAEYIEAPQPAHKDIFTGERRFEQRFPSISAQLPIFMQGYDRSRESASAILEFLQQHFEVNEAMSERIMTLCES